MSTEKKLEQIREEAYQKGRGAIEEGNKEKGISELNKAIKAGFRILAKLVGR